MKMYRGILFLLLALISIAAGAQEITGVPGSPTATVTIDGKQIPPPPMPFKGVIKESATESTPYWPPRVAPPKGAPNILLIMTDDQGFGVSGTFGGVIPTPALDRIAKAGLRYTQFHSTALCSPTRAALITGRNHHSVGFGVISELSTGYPGYDSVISPEKASIGNILRDNGYATSWFGKNHNTPAFQLSASGPFDQWPSGMGFEYFYGFMGGETDQWTPFLFRDHTQIFPFVGNKDYNLTTDLADEAIKHIRDLNAAAPDQPFFVYYVPGGTHSPHQPKPEWVEKFKGKFDMGYEQLREVIFANQKKLGVIPENTQLTPLPPELPKWDSLSAPYKKLLARQAEVFAGYAAYTDFEIGRVIQAVEDMGKLDNTLIIYICGDNGTSPEGTLTGAYNQLTSYNGILKAPEPLQLLHYEDWGTDKTYPHMSVGWSLAFDTPFQWTKQVASHFGGTRQGLAISWPGHIKDVGAIRTQFHHVIDIVPTILEVSGIKAPEEVNGITQKPIEGVSMAYTFDAANAKAPSKRTTQYFEMAGNRGIYHDGWMANTTPFAPPWDLATGTLPSVVDGYKWELYNINEDFSQANNLAAKNPEKLKEMQALFLSEAAKYNVLPLDNTAFSRLLTPRPSAVAGKTVFTYTGENTGIPLGNAPSLLNRDYTITAKITVPKDGAEGMIVTLGGRFGGYAMYLMPVLLQFPLLIAMYAVIRPPILVPVTSSGVEIVGTQAVDHYIVHNSHIPSDSQLYQDVLTHQTGTFLGMNLQCSPIQAGGGNVPTKDSQRNDLVADKAIESPANVVYSFAPTTGDGTISCGSGPLSRAPYYLFLLAMILTTFYQQRQMQKASPPGAQTGQQQTIMKIMPVMFGVFGLQFAAGLLVYWTTANFWQIGQQYALLRLGHIGPDALDRRIAEQRAKGDQPTKQGFMSKLMAQAEAQRAVRDKQAGKSPRPGTSKGSGARPAKGGKGAPNPKPSQTPKRRPNTGPAQPKPKKPGDQDDA